MTDVSKIMPAFVFTADQIAVGLLIRLEVAVADDNVSLPGASVIAAEIDYLIGEENRILDKEVTVTDYTCARVADNGILDCSVSNTLVRVKSGKDTAVVNEILAVVGARNAPIL
jgi:hypothetical protein